MTDAVVIGSGPNGLAAAVILARAGLAVHLYEANSTLGGALRTVPGLEPGFMHDWGSAVHPMALASPFFRGLGLERQIPFIVPEASYGHAVTPHESVIAWRNLEHTAQQFSHDRKQWLRLFNPLVRHQDDVLNLLSDSVLRFPKKPIRAGSYGIRALMMGTRIAELIFREERSRALLAGVFAHISGRQPSVAAAASGLLLAQLAHGTGWPIPQGGSQQIANFLIHDFIQHGGKIFSDTLIEHIDQLPQARAYIFDTSVTDLLKIADSRLSRKYRHKLERFQYGNGSSKVDFALSEPVPWLNDDLRRSLTIHLGGSSAQIAQSEREVIAGNVPRKPYLLLSQPSLFDTTRAPTGKHTLWIYGHVPNGSPADLTDQIIREIELHAPGFRETILYSYATTAQDIAQGNRNMVGGDIAVGAVTVQQLIARPVLSRYPWRTSAPNIFLCSAATPMGPGVHGMGGFRAGQQVLNDVFGIEMPPPPFPVQQIWE